MCSSGKPQQRCSGCPHPWSKAMPRSPLDEIESEALDGNVVKALRLCIKLGGNANSANLREWASLELHGYKKDADLPDYRIVSAPICIDGATPGWMFTAQPISVFDLPDFAREDISEEVELRYSISALVEMVRSADHDGNAIKLSPSGAALLVKSMNMSGHTNGSVHRLYWQIASVSIREVVERVCTTIIELVNEMRAGMESGQKLPSSDVASQAVEVVVKGDNNRITLKDLRQTSTQGTTGNGPNDRRFQVAIGIIGILGALGFVLLRLLG